MQTDPIEIPINGDYESFRKASDAAIKQMQKMSDEEAKWAKFSEEQTRRAQSYTAVEKQKAAALAASAKEAEKQKFSFTELNSAMSVATQAIQVMKQGYDFAKEGAQLEMLELKFERLAVSVGTTSDALLNDLREATRGVYSDTELMSSAMDMMGLGLVKTHDEAVRLATVSAGLNMNMNQLVLTLTNMTTMRFDALGVKVDGFKEKVDKLKQSGMSADAAFKEAFLQQAEAQLELVGHAADTAAGSFMQFEAEWKNATDEMKKTSAEAFLPIIKGFNELNEETKTQYELQSELAAQMGMTQREAINLVDGFKDLVRQTELERIKGDEWNSSLIQTAEVIQGEVVPSLEELEKAEKEVQKGRANLINLSIELTNSQNNFDKKQQETLETIAEYESELSKLFPWELEKRDELLAKIDEQKQKYADDATAFEEASNRKIAMMTIEKIAMLDGVAGYSEAEAAKAQAVLDTLGVVEDSAIRQAIAFDRISSALADGTIRAHEMDQALRMMESGYSIDVILNTIASFSGVQGLHEQSDSLAGTPLGGGYSEGTGGWKTVPPGYPNDSYPIRLESGEKFAVIPNGQTAGGASAMSGGGGDSSAMMAMMMPILNQFTQTITSAVRSTVEKSGR